MGRRSDRGSCTCRCSRTNASLGEEIELAPVTLTHGSSAEPCVRKWVGVQCCPVKHGSLDGKQSWDCLAHALQPHHLNRKLARSPDAPPRLWPRTASDSPHAVERQLPGPDGLEPESGTLKSGSMDLFVAKSTSDGRSEVIWLITCSKRSDRFADRQQHEPTGRS